MHNRAVRRRRLVLGFLVALSLILLTAYFGESPAGTFHSMQRGAMDVLAPIQAGTNRVLKPGRDLFHWVGDTWTAKGERDKLKRERDLLRAEVAGLQSAGHENTEMRRLLDMNQALTLEEQGPLTARVIGRSPSMWYATLEIDKGRRDGLRPGQPVINGEGLVGKVKASAWRTAVITLLTDPNFAVAAKTSRSNESGILASAVASPGNMRFDLVGHAARITKGEKVITAGTDSPRLPSLFPKGILIGNVARVEEGDGELDRKIHVKPFADLRRLEFVQVLIKSSTSHNHTG